MPFRSIKLQDVPQIQITNNRRKLRQDILKVLGEKAAITEEKVEKVLLKA
jgi:hypothetical protein